MKRMLSIVTGAALVLALLAGLGAGAPAAQQERYLYVATVNVGDQDPDFLTVIGVDPTDKATYGRIVHRVDMAHPGDELHHFGYNHDRTKLMVPGLFSNRIYVLGVSDPARPVVERVNEQLAGRSGHIVPHTVIGLPGGTNLVTMIGAKTETTAPGGLVEIDGTTGAFLRHFGPAPGSNGHGPIKYMYDAGFKRELNRMVTTTFGLPRDVAGGINPAGLGDEVYVWDWKARTVIQRVKLAPNAGALEVRWRADPRSTVGYTNAPGTDQIWAWDDADGDGRFRFQPVIQLPKGSVPTDMLLSFDDKFLYVSNWMGNNVRQYDITDPLQPRLTGEVEIPYAQMLRLSLDNKRLYVTNSLLSTWDDTEFPKGVTRNREYGVFRIDIDHENGGMTRNPDFHVDMMNVRKKHTTGPARPHMMLFDPATARNEPAGHH